VQPEEIQVDLTESECACEECRRMCNRPCWPTPGEAQRLIDAGYGSRLMRDYWVGDGLDGGDIYLLSPANPGMEGSAAGFWPSEGCVFQGEDGFCELHDLGLKPLEGRVASCSRGQGDLHQYVASTWNNPEAQALVDEWLGHNL
jgi:hypothetical protein